MNDIVVIFSGYNIRAVIAFIRTLESNNIRYAIVAKSVSDDIFNTVYSDKVICIREKIKLDLPDLLLSIEQVRKETRFDRCMIAPSTEALNRFYLDNIKAFNRNKCFMPLVEKKLYEVISDKLSFVRLCEKHVINTPKEYLSLDSQTLPLVAKPKKYFSSNNEVLVPIIIYNKNELDLFRKSYSIEDFYYQEYVGGKSIYLLYYFDSDCKVYKLSQENLIQQESGKSMIYSKVSNHHNEEISLEFERMFVKENFRGLVMIELKLKNNRYCMIEANPRFWGPSQLFVDAKYNFFEFMLYDYKFLKTYKNEKVKMECKYFWEDGISYNINARDNISFYNYSKEEFELEKNKLKKIEIFNRCDTKSLYKGKRI